MGLGDLVLKHENSPFNNVPKDVFISRQRKSCSDG